MVGAGQAITSHGQLAFRNGESKREEIPDIARITGSGKRRRGGV